VAARLAVPGRPGRHMVFLLSAASLMSLALVGHAAMHEGWPGDLHKANDAIHMLAAAGWIGCLVALVPCLTMLGDPDLRRQACAALIRFSAAGHVAVALVLLTGVANTWLVVGHWPVDLRSLYQLLLLGKIVLAVTMVALALVNRYAVVPAIRVRGASAVTDLRRHTIVELGLAGGVLALVSLFGLLDPT
jgi:copper resistance protein D